MVCAFFIHLEQDTHILKRQKKSLLKLDAMEILFLPKALNLKDSLDIQVYDYNTAKEATKQKVNLTQNVISFLIEGRKEVFSDSRSINIQNSSFLIIRKGHCLMTERLSAPHNNYRSILLFFSDDAIINFMRKYNILNRKNVLSKAVTPFEYDDFTNAIANSLMSISNLNTVTQKKLLQVKFEELMLYLTDIKGTQFVLSLFFGNDNFSGRFLSIVENNKLKKMSLNELAFLSSMSLSTFKRAFSKHFKESPSKWFLDQRLEHSAYLLKHKNHRPSDIFEDVGFNTLSNFIQAFKSKYGVTPKQYK